MHNLGLVGALVQTVSYIYVMKAVAKIFFLLSLLLSFAKLPAQVPVKYFNRSGYTAADSIRLLKEYGRNKTLIPQFALPTLVALSYFPELKDTRITFIIKPAHSPLCTNPRFKGIFSRKTRMFTIIISDSTMWKLEPITLSHMAFNIQIGVLGHELSHVSDFLRRSFTNLTGTGIGHVSSKYIDRFEYNTDSICIDHGLGYQLLAWSMFVRKTLGTSNYDGADNIDKPMMHERYMNPETIIARMKNNLIYK